jgi:thioredoxin-like negative regulator of GroEL
VAAILEVNADQEPEAIRRHRVERLPTLAFFKRGREIRRLRGGALPASTLRALASG